MIAVRTRLWLVVGAVGVVALLGFMLLAVGPLVVPLWGAPGAIGLWALGFGTVGALVARNRPDNPVGWRLLLAAAGSAIAFVNIELSTEVGLVDRTWRGLAGTTASWIWAPAVIAMATAILRFPDGSLPSRRWQLVEPALLVVAAVLAVASAFGPTPRGVEVNPLTAERWTWLLVPLSAEGFIVYIPLQLLLSLCIAAPFARYRGAGGVQRQQLRLLAAVALLVAVTVFVAEVIVARLVPEAFVASWITSLAVLLLPVAMGVAILRYRLYDIDRIVSRTVAYTVVTAVLAGVYVGSVVLLQALLRPVAADSDLAVAGSTLAVAALFGPVRRRVQATVDRRFNRRRYDAARAVASFGQRLRDEVDLDTVRSDLHTTVARTVEPASVSLWVRSAPETSR